MATIANTAFEARVTNNQFDALCNITGLYRESTVNADCPAGLLVVRGANLPCEGFGSEVLNENAYYMESATSDVTANTPIYAANMYEAKMVDGYFIGMETLGLPIPAGRYGTFTRIYFDGAHEYRFGVGNAGTLSSGYDYLTIDAGLLSPESSAPAAGTPYFYVKGTGKFIEGTSESFGYIDVEARIA